MYGYIKQYIPLSREEILKRITEEEIFSYIFNENIDLHKKYVAPYRQDNNAGCFFSFYNDKLQFVDFGDKETHKNCFDLFRRTYNLSYRETLERINSIFKLGLGGNSDEIKEVKYTPKIENTISPNVKKETKILCYLRDYNLEDLKFWGSYGISKEQLISDKVYPVIAFKSEKNGEPYIINNLKQSYVFSDFEGNRLKIYSPYSNYKWVTNCNQNDIGEINKLPKKGNRLIITKSYKDCRVLRNMGLNSIWLQNERVVPRDDTLKDLCKRFKDIYVFFDNDSTGLSHTKVMMDKLKEVCYKKNKIKNILIPPILLKDNIKDISDFRKIKGRDETIKFLKEKIQ